MQCTYPKLKTGNSIIHDNQKVETIQVSVNKCMDKQDGNINTQWSFIHP